MAAVPVTIVGIETRSDGTSENVVLVGMASLTGLGVGGGPMPPGKPPGSPPGIWPGPGDPDFPGGGKPPGIWGGGNEPFPTPPIHIPPIVPVPPDRPNVPPPGSPPVIVSGTTPTHPIVPPAAVIIDYPGIGKVVVPKPTETAPDSGPK